MPEFSSDAPTARLYAEALFNLGHGFPLFRPAPLLITDMMGTVSSRDEVHLGAVGFVTHDGFFRTIGNVNSIRSLEAMGMQIKGPTLLFKADVTAPAVYNTAGHNVAFNAGDNASISSHTAQSDLGFSVELGNIGSKGGFLPLPDGAHL